MAQDAGTGRRGPFIALGAVVVTAVIVGVVVAPVVLGRTGGGPSGQGAPEQGIAGYAGSPSSAWVADLPGTVLAPHAGCTGFERVWAADSVVVISTDDACLDPMLVGLAAADGEPRWTHPTDATCEAGLWGGRIACADAGGVFTLDAATGQREEVEDMGVLLGLTADVLVVRTGADSRVMGLAADGSEVFSHDDGDAPGHAVAVSGRHLLMSAWRECVDDFRSGIGFCVYDLALLDVTTGERIELGLSYTDRDRTPTLVAAAGDPPLVLTATDDAATIHDTAGTTLWSEEREVVFASGGVIGVRDGEAWISVDPLTGDERWRTSGPHDFVTTDAEHVVFITGAEIRALDRHTGEVTWSGPMPQADGVEVIRYESAGGRLWAWALVDGGGPRWVGYRP
ncbi:PQQ-binding-like beta-propeller repeat protein [Occultella aeris]|uniref:PQQ enzyme repeat protein n=1 Tax=Occultella aeris TaxID=2761496 RepID=A0A7M4DNW8_9MICO|nr:PQQ-binding-like beta-propeller repeat protein [Occultella aeris]VZO39154.1 PQQ enzyme repeat protein [Occultella aeris]